MKLTDAQQRVIVHRGSSLLVAASAGAGKTEVLARRCVALVADPQHPCALEQLLVVTFTRAAAAELRVRIARMLRDEAAKTPDAGRRRHLRRQALLVDAADIGTIDAWCGRLVREHYADAGVDVRFTTLSEEDAHLLRAAALDDLFKWVYSSADPLAGETRSWLARGPVPDDESVRTLVAQLNRFREHLINPDEWLTRQRAAGEADDTAAVLTAALAAECRFQEEQLTALLASNAAAEVRAALRPYLDQLGAWLRMLAAPDGLRCASDELKAFKIAKPGRGKSEPALVSDVRQRWLTARLCKRWAAEAIAPVLQHGPLAAERTRTLLQLETRYEERLRDAKRQRAAYEFGDVLRLALDLLGRPADNDRRVPTDIARRLRERYAHVLVDEFQDTSPVQVELLRLVTRDTPGATNAFFVGDVKQSIYGFREAEPRLFVELADALDSGRAEGRVAHLADNFRSHDGLLTPLNELFARLFDRRLGGTAYAPDEWLRAGRAPEELPNPTLDERPRVRVCVLEHDPRAADSDDDDQQDVERIEREAQLAAEQIQQMLRDGVQVAERGADDKPRLRTLRAGDVVVLLRAARKNAALVARVLRDNGLPCIAQGREKLLDVVEVRDVCNVLALLVNRRQDIPLAAYLRSPLVGLDEAELLAVRATAEPGADYYAAVQEYRRVRPSAALAVKLDAALGQLDRWARVAREAELPTLLRTILHESAWTLFAAALRDGAQRVALLEALRSFAAAYARGGEGALDGFAAHLEQLAAEEIEPAAQAPGPEDAVRVMTIHGAKGLEFPVVFLLGAGARFNTHSQARSLQCDAELGFGLRFSDYPTRATVRSARHIVVARRVAEREREEELRLLYVAATRARERLVVVGHAPVGAWEECLAMLAGQSAPPLIARLGVANHLAWVMQAAACVPEATRSRLLDIEVQPATAIGVPEPGRPRPEPPAPPWSPADEAWLRRGRELLAAEPRSVYADFPAVLSVSALKEHARRAADGERAATLAMPAVTLSAPRFGVADAETDGRAVGTACHRFLEHADLARLRDAEAVQTQVARLVEAGCLSAAEAALLPIADVAWFANTPDGCTLATAPGVRREVPFVYALPLDAAGERTIVRGVIDCLYESASGLVLLDYKTDTPRDAADWAARLAGYRMQLQVYAHAAAAIFGRPVTRALLVFVRARRIEDVPTATSLNAALLRPSA